MNNNVSVPWDSGTLTCDMNADGSVFRLQGNVYCSTGSGAWGKSVWIPGVDGWAGLKTFKVKQPSDGKARCIYGAGMAMNTYGGMNVGNVNTDTLVVGSDGYVYVMKMEASPGNDYPISVAYFGVVVHVDSTSTTYGYSYGNGA